MLLITPITASLLGMLFLKLSFAVIGLRRKNKVGLGSGGHDDLERAIRAQGNFAEYVPLALILMGILEFNGAPFWLVMIPATLLIVGRLFHAKGIKELPPHFENRVRGMKLTFGSLYTLIFFNLAWLVYKLLM